MFVVYPHASLYPSPQGDYRRLYAMRQQELADRAAAAKERIAAAYQQVEANKEGRKAKVCVSQRG